MRVVLLETPYLRCFKPPKTTQLDSFAEDLFHPANETLPKQYFDEAQHGILGLKIS
jgi:hypothetical protein